MTARAAPSSRSMRTWLPAAALTLLIPAIPVPAADTVELNPYFPRRQPPQPPPIIATIQGQITRGCVSGRGGLRPLADRYDLRHQLRQPEPPALSRAAAAITVADPDYAEARAWLQPLLTDPDPRIAYAAYAVLLSHAIRRIDSEMPPPLSPDLRQAETLANGLRRNPSDLYFWRAVVAARAGDNAQALDLARRARDADRAFYNARLLELELLLERSRRELMVSAGRCQAHAVALLESAVALFQLDTCPRHAVLLLNWLRAQRRDADADPFAQLITGYVAVVLNSTAGFDAVLQRLQGGTYSPCRRQVLHTVAPLGELLDRGRRQRAAGPP